MTNVLLRRYEKLSGEDAETLLDFHRRNYLRINPLAPGSKNALERLKQRGAKLREVSWLSQGFSYTSSFSLGASEEYLLGLIHIQDAASQLPVDALALMNINPKLIVDMAAAPGGKTAQLAAQFPKAKIVAFEANRKRTESLKNNLERLHTSNVTAHLKDSRFASDIISKADIVLLDAPCSGNFALHKKWFSRREKQGFTFQDQLQRQLLKEALKITKKDGIVVYSTCSLEPSENEGVLTKVLSDKDEIIPINLPVGRSGVNSFGNNKFRDDCSNAIRVWPHEYYTQGFFLAAIRKG